MANSAVSMRKRLEGYADMRKELDMQTLRLEQMRDTIGDIRSPQYKPGKTRCTPSDGVSRNVVMLERLEERVERLRILEHDEREALERMIEHLYNAKHRALLRMRYFDALDWTDIAFQFYGDRVDFFVEEHEYTRKLYRLHTRAVGALACVHARQMA